VRLVDGYEEGAGFCASTALRALTGPASSSIRSASAIDVFTTFRRGSTSPLTRVVTREPTRLSTLAF